MSRGVPLPLWCLHRLPTVILEARAAFEALGLPEASPEEVRAMAEHLKRLSATDKH